MAAFYTPKQYHDIGLKTIHLLRSTYAHAEGEVELPPTMLALVATAVRLDSLVSSCLEPRGIQLRIQILMLF